MSCPFCNASERFLTSGDSKFPGLQRCLKCNTFWNKEFEKIEMKEEIKNERESSR